MSLFDNVYNDRYDYKCDRHDRSDRCDKCDRCEKCERYERCECEPCNEKWSALGGREHPMGDPTVDNNLNQVNSNTQSTDELIAIKDSCDVRVNTTTTDVAVTIQVAIQVAIAIIIEVSIADGIEEREITNELLQLTKIRQCNNQRTIIENSRGVEVTTTDTNLAISAQIAIQILVALLVALDIL